MVNVRVGGLIVKQARRLPVPNVRVGGLLVKQARRLAPPTVRVGGLLVKQARVAERLVNGGAAYEADVALRGLTSSTTVGNVATETDRAIRGLKQVTTYKPAVLALSPQAYYRLNESSGLVAHDSSGHGYDATFAAAPAWSQPSMSADGSGAAVLFSGSQEAETAATVPAHDYVSIVVPVYPTASFTTIVDRNGHYRLQVRSAQIRFQIRTNEAGGTTRQLDFDCAVNEVLQLAAVYDGTHLIAYVNGIEQARLNVAASHIDWGGLVADSTVSIGGTTGVGGSFAGTMQDVAIFDKALTPAQVASLAHTFSTWVVEGQADGVNSETDTALAGRANTLVNGGLATEFDTGIGTTTVQGGSSAETDSVLHGVSAAGTRVIGGASVEGETALAGRTLARLFGGLAAELDSAAPGSTTNSKVILGGLSVEGETALPGAGSVLFVGSAASETDLASHGATNFGYAGGPTSEADVALLGSVHLGFRVVGGTADELDAAAAGRPNVIAAGASATETDSSAAGRVALVTEGHSATDRESALPGLTLRFGGASVHRWQLHDPSTGEVYVFPVNPNKMTSPHPAKQSTVFARNFNFEDEKAGVGRVLLYHQEPYQWQFSGDIRSAAHYEALRDWCHRVGRLQITDHLGRSWLIRFDSVDLTEERPTFRHGRRYAYTAKAIVYGRVG